MDKELKKKNLTTGCSETLDYPESPHVDNDWMDGCPVSKEMVLV